MARTTGRMESVPAGRPVFRLRTTATLPHLLLPTSRPPGLTLPLRAREEAVLTLARVSAGLTPPAPKSKAAHHPAALLLRGSDPQTERARQTHEATGSALATRLDPGGDMNALPGLCQRVPGDQLGPIALFCTQAAWRTRAPAGGRSRLQAVTTRQIKKAMERSCRTFSASGLPRLRRISRLPTSPCTFTGTNRRI